MLALLLKIIFSIVSLLSNLVTRLIFSATAYAIVLLIHAFKVPGEALQGALEQLAEVIRGFIEYFIELIIELTGSLVSSAFDLIIEVVTTCASASGSAFSTLMENTKTSLEELLTGLPEIAEGFWEMISTVIEDLWNNCQEALGYVTENA